MSRPARGLLAPENRAVSLAVMASMALAFYNATSVTAALPEIGADLGRVALTQWVITVELLAAAIAVLAIGPFIDGAGVRRAYRLAVVGFAAASALCSAAPTMEVLVVARLVQGLATGSLIGAAMTCIGLAYDPALRPRAYALVASVWGVMGVSGPAVAAALVSTLGWRSVFAANLPVAAVAAIAAWNRVPAEARARAEPLDRRGLALMGAISVALLLATSSLQWSSILLMVLAVLLYGLYVRHARRRPGPIVHISHITGRQWWPVHVVAIASIAGGTGASVFLPLYLKGGRGTSLSFAAFAVLWPTVGWAAASWVSSKLQERMRAQSVVVIGSFILTYRGGRSHGGGRRGGSLRALVRGLRVAGVGHRDHHHLEHGAAAEPGRLRRDGQGDLGSPVHPVARVGLRRRGGGDGPVLGGGAQSG